MQSEVKWRRTEIRGQMTGRDIYERAQVIARCTPKGRHGNFGMQRPYTSTQQPLNGATAAAPDYVATRNELPRWSRAHEQHRMTRRATGDKRQTCRTDPSRQRAVVA